MQQRVPCPANTKTNPATIVCQLPLTLNQSAIFQKEKRLPDDFKLFAIPTTSDFSQFLSFFFFRGMHY